MGGVSNIASAGINLALAQQANKRAAKQIKKDRNQEINEINDQAALKKQDEKAALQKRIATLRARTGASGLSSSGGSIDAVIRGLEIQTASENRNLDSAVSRRIQDVRQSSSNKRKRSLLDLANRFTGFGRASRSLLR